MLDFFSTSDWTHTTWMRWGFFVMAIVVGYVAVKIVEELRALRSQQASIDAGIDQTNKGIQALIEETRTQGLDHRHELHMIRRILEEKTGITAASVEDIDKRAMDERLEQLAALIDKRDSTTGDA